MAILIDETTKVVVSGITGREGTFHSGQMLAYGTQVVAGVTPGKGGQTWTSDDGKYTVPVFNTVAEAVEKTGANAHFVVVPPKFAADSIIDLSPNAICLADLNADRAVDDADFVFFAAAYNLLLCSDPAQPADCPADLNSDGLVNDNDFVVFVQAYQDLLCP